MAYIVEKHEEKMIDAISNADQWIKSNPAYRGMFDRIADTRQGHVEKSPSIKVPEWRKVASMPSTMLDVLKIMSPDGVHLDKKQFYPWLNRNPHFKSRDGDLGMTPGFDPLGGM